MLRSFLEGVVTIGFTGVALWLFWKLMPGRWRFIVGLGLVLTFLFFVANMLPGGGPSPAPEPTWTHATSPPPAKGEVLHVGAAYSLASTVEVAEVLR